VGLGGLEPPTSRLSGVRSNQLSYRPTPSAMSLRRSSLQRRRAPPPPLTPGTMAAARSWPGLRGTNRARPECRPGSFPVPKLQKERE
jgi:hypothetical protein